jgi:hypothetical protein
MSGSKLGLTAGFLDFGHLDPLNERDRFTLRENRLLEQLWHIQVLAGCGKMLKRRHSGARSSPASPESGTPSLVSIGWPMLMDSGTGPEGPSRNHSRVFPQPVRAKDRFFLNRMIELCGSAVRFSSNTVHGKRRGET